ncbi:hypothetical protein [Undibacterium pigrum]|uniref:DUF695 domain-containing protein n=1 Tax=Undibacterium pigrum TaxID=401470 RepID=A0A318J7X3_9BURK|nr:hypothetical protein [Undibacterium pigrum]PXX42516.1 hypothetical protein DFR42_105174 [Undibacterium pigrum]
MSTDLFWQALANAQPQLQQMEIRDVMEAINALLEPHFPKLAAELQGKTEDGVYDLIITAHGATEHFQDVMRLTQTAPKLAMFPNVIAFRARTEMGEFGMSMDNFSLSPSDILVSHYADAGRVGLQLWFAKPIPQDMVDHARNMSFILLDHALGEYDFAIKIGPVDFMEEESAQETISLASFPAVLDSFWRDELKHTALFPTGDYEWTGFELVSNTDPDDKLVVQRNESAMALVGRADMLWRLQVDVELNNKEDLEIAREFEDQLETLLAQTQEGITSQITLHGNVRSMNWQVSDAETAVARAHKLAQNFSSLEFDINSEFDPQWQDYLRWVS